jgi:hypothetical protein
MKYFLYAAPRIASQQSADSSNVGPRTRGLYAAMPPSVTSSRFAADFTALQAH